MFVAAAIGLAAQIMYPLFEQTKRTGPTLVVIFAVFVICCASACHSIKDVAVIGVACLLGWTAEYVGSRTGLPFGDYSYSTALQPQLAGVPIVVCLAWTSMAVAAASVATTITERLRLPSTATQKALTIAIGAVALTGWDVFLDPQMVAEGYWSWKNPGGFRGIPWSNYAGWLLVSTAIVTVVLPLTKKAQRLPLWLLYTAMNVMSALGFLLFFDDVVVAAAGAFVTFPIIWLSRPASLMRRVDQRVEL